MLSHSLQAALGLMELGLRNPDVPYHPGVWGDFVRVQKQACSFCFPGAIPLPCLGLLVPTGTFMEATVIMKLSLIPRTESCDSLSLSSCRSVVLGWCLCGNLWHVS